MLAERADAWAGQAGGCRRALGRTTATVPRCPLCTADVHCFVRTFYTPQVEREREAMEEAGDAPVAAPAPDPAKRARHNVVGVGKASGRAWKAPAQRAGSLRNPKLGTSWEKKMAVKAEEAAYKERKRAAQAARKEAAAEERRRREQAKKRKEEKRAAAAVTTRVSAATARRMMKSKKARKLLKTGDA